MAVWHDEVPQPATPLPQARSDLAPSQVTVVIEHRTFVRDCIMRGLTGLRLDCKVIAFASVDQWIERRVEKDDDPLVLLSTSERTPEAVRADCLKIGTRGEAAIPIVLLAEDASANAITQMLGEGVRGYIPTSVPLRVAFEAIQLVRAGGIYIPATAFLSPAAPAAAPSTAPSSGPVPPKTMFTGRQAAVVLALRRGTSNKIIAHELDMAESTVKVHVRNIMRKLKARNRTHVAFLLNEMEASSP